MSTRRIVTGIAGLAFLTALGLSPAPAGAQASTDGNVVLVAGPIVPQPCTDCDTHNAQPGSGPGIFTAAHACDVGTGQGVGIYFLGNPNNTPVTYNFNSVSGSSVVEHNYTGTIPAHAGIGKVPTVNLQVADEDRNQVIHLVGTLAGRPINQTFSCPCLQPVTTTVATTVPSSTPTTPGTTPGTPVTSAAIHQTFPAGSTLPATGGNLPLFFGLLGGFFLLWGAFSLVVSHVRKSREA